MWRTQFTPFSRHLSCLYTFRDPRQYANTRDRKPVLICCTFLPCFILPGFADPPPSVSSNNYDQDPIFLDVREDRDGSVSVLRRGQTVGTLEKSHFAGTQRTSKRGKHDSRYSQGEPTVTALV